MRNLIHTTKKRLTPLLAASVLLTGGIGASVLFTGGTAEALPCAPGQVAGTGCQIVGTLALTGGALTLNAPTAVGWAHAVTGADLVLSDPTAADETYTVNDASGTAAGWHVTADATAFAVPLTGGVGTPGATLGTSGATTTPTFSTNGSLSLTAGVVGNVAPSAACLTGTTCTVGTNSVATYPVVVTDGNAATVSAVTIYDAPIGSGLGTIVIGGSGATDPVGWWLNVPSNTLAGTYISAVTLELITGP